MAHGQFGKLMQKVGSELLETFVEAGIHGIRAGIARTL